MNEVFVTSDLHLMHNKPFLYEPRGFTCIEEHDETIVKNWNEIVKYNDEAFILGDLMLMDNDAAMKYLKRLNGKIHVILGNHDSAVRAKLYADNGFDVLGYAYPYRLKGYNLFMTHYPTITSNYDINKPLKSRVINVCGHSHTKNRFQDIDKGLIYHCELDAHENKPVNIEKIIPDIRKNYPNI